MLIVHDGPAAVVTVALVAILSAWTSYRAGRLMGERLGTRLWRALTSAAAGWSSSSSSGS